MLAGTANITSQKGHASVSPIVSSALSTTARAAHGSGAAAIIVP